MSSFGVARKTSDSAGGTQLAGGQGFVRERGDLVVLLGDPVQSHGDSPHDNATMAQGSPFVFIGGVAVCRQGHLATCGHATTGSDLARLGA